MSFPGINYTNQSPSHSPRRTRSFDESPFHGWEIDGAQEYQPAFESTSLRTPAKISRGLLVKLSRFEPLDALGVPFPSTHPELQPSPLQSHQMKRQSSLLKTHTDMVERTNLPAVFDTSTCYKDKEREKKVISMSEINQEDGAFDDFDARVLQSTLENIRSRIRDTPIEVCYKSTSMKLQEGGQSQKIPPKGALVGNLSLSRTQTPRRGLNLGSSTNVVRDRPISRVSGILDPSPQRKAYTVYRDSFDSSVAMSKINTINTYNNGKEHQEDVHAPHIDSTFENVKIVPRSTTPDDHDKTQKGSPIAKYTINKIDNGIRGSYKHNMRPLSPRAKSLGPLRALAKGRTGSHDKQPQQVRANVETAISRAITSSSLKISSNRDMFREGEASVTATATLKDKIEFFDGATSRVASTVVRPCFASDAPPATPIYHRLSTTSRQANTTSATETVRRLSAATNPKPMTPTRTFRAISQSPARRKQNLVFGSPIKNPFESPASTSKSSIASISPTNRRVSSLPRQSPAASLTSQGSPARGIQDFRSSMTLIREDSSETVRKQTWWSNTSRAREDTISSLSKRRISDKIDKFMQADSMKRRQESAKEEPKPANDTLTSSREGAPSASHGVVANLRRSFESQRSKVTDMKRMFDGGNGARPSIVPAADEAPRRAATLTENKNTPQKKRDMVLKNTTPSHQPSPSRLLVFPPRYSTSVKAKTSPSKTINQSPKISMASPKISMASPKISMASETRAKESPVRNAPLVTSKPQAKSKTIGERMKLFEKSTVEEPKPQESKRRAFGRKINRSLKGLFESHSPGKSEDSTAKVKAKHTTRGSKEAKLSNKDKSRGGMAEKEVKSAMDEFQDFMPVSPTRKAGTAGKGGEVVGGRWLQMGQDGTDSRVLTPIDSTTVSEHEMIVKEVKCGLKHPRPMRGTEMTRMMALCREKVGMGSLRYKEKEKVAKVGQSRLVNRD